MTPRDVVERVLPMEVYGGRDQKASAILAALRQAGFAVVPIEPTPRMIQGALDRPHGEDLPLIYHGIWRAMVDAASEPQPAWQDGAQEAGPC